MGFIQSPIKSIIVELKKRLLIPKTYVNFLLLIHSLIDNWNTDSVSMVGFPVFETPLRLDARGTRCSSR